MKAKWFSFILLALCLVLALTGCAGGSGGGGTSGGGTGNTFVVTNISPNDGLVITQVPGKGIKFTQGGVEWKIYVTLKLEDDNTFSSVEQLWVDGIQGADSVFTGTWEQPSSTTIVATATKEKDNLAGTTTTIDPPDVDNFTLSADGKTLTQTEEDPDYHTKLILTKQ